MNAYDLDQVVETLMLALEDEYGGAFVTASGVSWLEAHHVPVRRLVTRVVRRLLLLGEVPADPEPCAAENLVVAKNSASFGYVAYDVSESGLSFLLGRGEPEQFVMAGSVPDDPVRPPPLTAPTPVSAVSWSSRHAETLLPVLSVLSGRGLESTVMDMASEAGQRFPDDSGAGVTVIRLPREVLDRQGGVATQNLALPVEEHIAWVGRHEVSLARLAMLAAQVLVRSAGCTQPSWTAALHVEQWLDAVLGQLRSRVLLCSNDTSPLGVLAVRAAERAAADTVYVQHGAWVEGQISWRAQHCRHIAVMGSRDVRTAHTWTRRVDARTYVVGQPRFDPLVQVDRRSQRSYLQGMLRQRAGAVPPKIVVWACQPFTEQRLLGQVEVLAEGLRHAQDRWGLVIAPHPAQSAQPLSALFDATNGVVAALAAPEVGARGCLAGADALISASSTCGIEALLLGVPVLELVLPVTRTLRLADHGAAQCCTSSQDITTALTRIDESPRAVRVPAAAREAICRWDGRSAGAVADVVVNALIDGSAPHHSAQGTDVP
ncbi:hypothetical protein [Streptomyces sp. H27-D2]|uniref:hypothetical protein n=1 Tax=Streptomyces sp. H27-D2 TaxID=3046304 RepID=UPI002DB7020C|nr:hypothetical protein [Streptomyces sp. H27-D2]MEC4020482.1 hypothetical protein [Streptomyces sp. H27-D2]